MKKVLFTANTFSDKQLEELKDKGYEIIPQKGTLTEDELIQALTDIDAYIQGGDEIVTAKVINSTTKLKIIAFLGAGYERYIDIKAANEKGIVVTNTPRANAHTVAEHTVALIMDTVKKTTALNNDTKKGGWNKKQTWNLQGKTVGIVGMGAIGSEVAKILHKGFDMNVLYYSRTPKNDIEKELQANRVELVDLFQKSDIVSLHISYSDETINLINEQLLNVMKPNSILINASRAEIIEPKALLKAIDKGIPSAVALDVYYKEPVPNPKDDSFGFLGLPDDKFIITPHTAYNSSDAIKAMETMILESLFDFFDGKQLRYKVN